MRADTIGATAALSLALLMPLDMLRAQAPDGAAGAWSLAVALGAGRASVTTDQGRGGTRSVYLLDFRLSRAVGDRLRVGAQVGGWGFEAGDTNDPSKGEGVSTLGPFIQLFPIAGKGLFVEAGYGIARYQNNAPDEFDTDGSGWTAGAGHAFGRRGRFWVTVSAHASGGRFDDVVNVVVTETGWRHSAADVRVTGGLRLGRRAN